MQRSFFGLALVLGLISAVGPFAIDMYLPACPPSGARWTPARAPCRPA
jgi:DHA1 family bicyclomycin/chloramphenicol resistance-like MFS transporter